MAGDDSAPPAGEFWPNEDERIFYVLASEGGLPLGLFTLIPQNAVCYEIHAAVLPAAWGSRSRAALRGAIEWAWRETPARRIVAAVPDYNRLALKLARQSGFAAYGRNPRAFLKAGALHDVVLLGLSRAE